MKYLKLTTCMLAILSLGACFGSDGEKVTKAAVDDPVIVLDDPADDDDDGNDEPPEVVAATYTDKANSINELNNSILAGLALDVSDDDQLDKNNSDLPNLGSADYAGIMDINMAHLDPDEAVLLGEFNMNVDFKEQVISGGADNFSNSLDEVWSGALVIDGTYAGVEVDGTLTNAAGLNTDIEMDVATLAVYGSEHPDAPEYLEGTMTGNASFGSSDTNSITGGFIGQITN